MNKSFIIKQISPIIVLILVLTLALTLKPDQSRQTSTVQCTYLDAPCRFILDTGELVVDIGQVPIVLEEEIPVRFTLPDTLRLEQASIAGVNMYMGRLPVLVDSPAYAAAQVQVPGVFFLGSCSEPNMRWQMTVQLRDNETDEVMTRYVNFVTQR